MHVLVREGLQTIAVIESNFAPNTAKQVYSEALRHPCLGPALYVCYLQKGRVTKD